VPYEGSGKPLLTGMFMIFPWDNRNAMSANTDLSCVI
jgi:hypothetical protein